MHVASPPTSPLSLLCFWGVLKVEGEGRSGAAPIHEGFPLVALFSQLAVGMGSLWCWGGLGRGLGWSPVRVAWMEMGCDAVKWGMCCAWHGSPQSGPPRDGGKPRARGCVSA